jgi:dTDP-4-amino-4,6-dideoxygalactose transaminase
MPGECPVAEKAYSRCISLPLYATLTEADQDTVVATLKDILKG